VAVSTNRNAGGAASLGVLLRAKATTKENGNGTIKPNHETRKGARAK
jgi:hypothetical protein